MYFRVSKLENMIKGNVKMGDLLKLENKMASKEDIQELKEIMNDIKHIFNIHSTTQEKDKEEKGDLLQSCITKIEK